MMSMMKLFLFSASAILMTRGVPVRDVARNVRSELLIVENPNAINPRVNTNPNHNRIQDNSDVPSAAGGALDLFYRYGFFSLSVRVVPRNDPGSWLVREPTASIFVHDSLITNQEFGPDKFDPYFQVYLCDDNNELLEAYFKDFKADGVDQPYKLYTGSWRTSTVAKYMGLSKESLDGDSSFVLVKMMKRHSVIKMEGNPRLVPEAQKDIESIQDGDFDSVLNFIHNYGSHYIKELTIGDVIYQVFALKKDQYSNLKTSLKGVTRLGARDFGRVYQEALAPWLVRETGEIKAASGDFRLEQFLEEEPRFVAKFGSYPNIFEFQRNPPLMRKLESMAEGTKAVIGLKFASLRFLVPSIRTREFYDEVLNTQFALWEVNI